MTLNWISINCLSTIPVIRYLLKKYSSLWRTNIVHMQISGVELSMENHININSLGLLGSVGEIKSQSLLFRIKKYLFAYACIVAVCLRSRQLLILNDYQ